MATTGAQRQGVANAARLLVNLGAAISRRRTARRGTAALGALLAESGRHPLTPAAIRVERSSARADHAESHQTALTVWFGEGPALPGPSAGRPPVRTLVGTVAGIAGVVALGALGVLAQREPHTLAAPPAVPRLPQP